MMGARDVITQSQDNFAHNLGMRALLSATTLIATRRATLAARILALLQGGSLQPMKWSHWDPNLYSVRAIVSVDETIGGQ